VVRSQVVELVFLVVVEGQAGHRRRRNSFQDMSNGDSNRRAGDLGRRPLSGAAFETELVQRRRVDSPR